MRMHATNYCLNHVVKCPCITFLLTRHDWIQEIIHGNNNRCYEDFSIVCRTSHPTNKNVKHILKSQTTITLVDVYPFLQV